MLFHFKARKTFFVFFLAALLFASACQPLLQERPEKENKDPAVVEEGETVKLPPLEEDTAATLQETLERRVSSRNFTEEPLLLQQVAQVLWAAQGSGVDGTTGATRTVPSAGGTHPMEIYVVAGNIENISAGVYNYDIAGHRLEQRLKGDFRAELADAALGQNFIAEAPASIVLAAEFGRTTSTYGERGERYVLMESGGVSQNIELQAAALELGSVVVGAFEDQDLSRLLEIEEAPLLIIPLGHTDD